MPEMAEDVMFTHSAGKAHMAFLVCYSRSAGSTMYKTRYIKFTRPWRFFGLHTGQLITSNTAYLFPDTELERLGRIVINFLVC